MQPTRLAVNPQAAKRHLSPDELDRPLRLVKPRAWVALLGLAALCAAAAAWSVLGRLPETVEAGGVLATPGGVIVVESPHDGVFAEVKVRAGDIVSQGAAVALLSQGDLSRRLEQAKLGVTQLEDDDRRQAALEASRDKTEAALRVSRAATLDAAIADGVKLLDDLQTKTRENLSSRREQLTRSKTQLEEHARTLAERLDSAKRLQTARLVTAEAVMAAESAQMQNAQSLLETESRLADLQTKDLETKQVVTQSQLKLSELRIQRKEIDLQEVTTRQEHLRNRAIREVALREAREKAKLLETSLDEKRVVRSPAAGRLLELAVHAGQTATPGQKVGVLLRDGGGEPRLIAYFPVGPGKRITPGMAARVTPTTVQRERFGGIYGRVTRVSAYPVTEQSAILGVGNPEVVQGLRRPGGAIEVEIELERADTPSGYRWTSAGPPEPFSPGTTAVVRVTVEERAPISYLLPTLRTWLGSSE